MCKLFLYTSMYIYVYIVYCPLYLPWYFLATLYNIFFMYKHFCFCIYFHFILQPLQCLYFTIYPIRFSFTSYMRPQDCLISLPHSFSHSHLCIYYKREKERDCPAGFQEVSSSQKTSSPVMIRLKKSRVNICKWRILWRPRSHFYFICLFFFFYFCL